ncbi:MAG TPA: isoprenylcysteine carboxylmethyltransferase family protein [Bryobacteraceae bacterium]|nr:isoprenylcysteine carboxylmethyltransferase family protein [Bryobacteraceae bacterium]
MMKPIPWLELLVWWFAWFFSFMFRAPHVQKRESITLTAPTLAGLFFEVGAIFLAATHRIPPGSALGMARVAASVVFGALAAVLSWTSVTHLGKQFRLRAGLYADHELVRTGPYAVVRHPIYASLLAILLCTIALLTPWQWGVISVAAFVVGTEIRVRAEDKLLESRFGEEFRAYRRRVRAYVPLVR